MPATMTELTGGHFQDAEGNVLANGYLKMILSTDGGISGVGMVCAGITITINLDANGSVIAGQYVWGNDVITPVNSYYTVTGYTAAGQPAFGPNLQQVISGATFDVGTWVPNTAISWIPPATLQGPAGPTGPQGPQGSQGPAGTNGTNGTTPVLPTHGFVFGSQNATYLPYDNNGVGSASRGNSKEVGVVLLVLLEQVTFTSASIYCITGAGSGNMYSGIYSYDGNTKYIDTGALDVHSSSQVLRSTSFSAVTLPAGCYWYAWGNDTSVGADISGRDAQNWFNAFVNGITVTFGSAANPISGGHLPTTLGTITAYAHTDSNTNIPETMFQ
jgi:hypothetical protein